jgi:hypothetical protein
MALHRTVRRICSHHAHNGAILMISCASPGRSMCDKQTLYSQIPRNTYGVLVIQHVLRGPCPASVAGITRCNGMLRLPRPALWPVVKALVTCPCTAAALRDLILDWKYDLGWCLARQLVLCLPSEAGMLEGFADGLVRRWSDSDAAAAASGFGADLGRPHPRCTGTPTWRQIGSAVSVLIVADSKLMITESACRCDLPRGCCDCRTP